MEKGPKGSWAIFCYPSSIFCTWILMFICAKNDDKRTSRIIQNHKTTGGNMSKIMTGNLLDSRGTLDMHLVRGFKFAMGIRFTYWWNTVCIEEYAHFPNKEGVDIYIVNGIIWLGNHWAKIILMLSLIHCF